MGSTSTSLTVSYVELLSNLWGDGEMGGWGDGEMGGWGEGGEGERGRWGDGGMGGIIFNPNYQLPIRNSQFAIRNY